MRRSRHQLPVVCPAISPFVYGGASMIDTAADNSSACNCTGRRVAFARADGRLSCAKAFKSSDPIGKRLQKLPPKKMFYLIYRFNGLDNLLQGYIWVTFWLSGNLSGRLLLTLLNSFQINDVTSVLSKDNPHVTLRGYFFFPFKFNQVTSLSGGR